MRMRFDAISSPEWRLPGRLEVAVYRPLRAVVEPEPGHPERVLDHVQSNVAVVVRTIDAILSPSRAITSIPLSRVADASPSMDIKALSQSSDRSAHTPHQARPLLTANIVLVPG